jgi:hypothetical protein
VFQNVLDIDDKGEGGMDTGCEQDMVYSSYVFVSYFLFQSDGNMTRVFPETDRIIEILRRKRVRLWTNLLT